MRISDWSSDVCSSDLVEAGWPVLVHAAAGGVGLILVQWLKAVGATVIGTVSTEAKEQAARDAGADHVIRYRNEDVAAHVREITDGQGVPVRSEERRVGKEGARSCRSRGCPYHLKKKRH